MATTLTAGTTTATSLVINSDTSGVLALAGGTATGITITNGVVSFPLPASGTISNATNATNATQIANSGGWNVTPTGTKLYFNYNGTNVASLDSSGNLRVLTSVISGTTP